MGMLTEHEIQRYREMGPEARYKLFLDLSAYAWHALHADGEELAQRRWALIRRQHEEASRRLEAKFRELA